MQAASNKKKDNKINKVNRMKKLEDIIYSSSPYVLALIVQLVVSMIGMLIYGLYTVDKGLPYFNMSDMINTPLTMEVSLIISAFSSIGCIIVFSIWYKKQIISDKSLVSTNKMRLKQLLLIVLLGVGLQIGMSYILSLIAIIKPNWFYKYGLLMEQLGNGTSLTSLLYIVVIAPIAEELIFRGVILNKGKKILPFFLANMQQAFLFGLYHMNWIQGVYAFIIGLFLGSICYGFQSIYAPIYMHVIINLCGLILGQIPMGEQYQTPLIFSVIIILSMLVIALSMYMLKKNYIQEDD